MINVLYSFERGSELEYKEVFEDCLVKIFGHGQQAVQENQKQIAGAKTACPYVYENAHQLVGVNIQNDRLKTRVLRCYFSAGRNVARCRLNVASGWLLYRTRYQMIHAETSVIFCDISE